MSKRDQTSRSTGSTEETEPMDNSAATHKQLQTSMSDLWHRETVLAVALELRRALEYYKVPEREKEEAMSAFIAHRDEVTTGFRISKKE